MEACHDYLGCKAYDCIMFGRKDNKRCWEVEVTSCNHHGIQLVREKLAGTKVDACIHSGCIYYKAAKDRGIL